MRLTFLSVAIRLSLLTILSNGQDILDLQQPADEDLLESLIHHANDEDGQQYPPLSSDAPKVKVLAAVESLCSGCKAFMNDQLFPAFNVLGSQVMDLEVVVFGNAMIDLKAKTVDCQHGVAECDANTYEQCAVDLYKYPDRYLPFLHCLDNDLTMGHRDEVFEPSIFAGCAQESALDFDSIKSCHDDKQYSWSLQRRAALSTPANHTYVPWIEINGAHTMDEDNDSLLAVVCQAYVSGGGYHSACPAVPATASEDEGVMRE